MIDEEATELSEAIEGQRPGDVITIWLCATCKMAGLLSEAQRGACWGNIVKHRRRVDCALAGEVCSRGVVYTPFTSGLFPE